MYDSLRKIKEYEASFVYQSDAIVIDQQQSFKIDPNTQQIRSYTTKENLSNSNSLRVSDKGSGPRYTS